MILKLFLGPERGGPRSLIFSIILVLWCLLSNFGGTTVPFCSGCQRHWHFVDEWPHHAEAREHRSFPRAVSRDAHRDRCGIDMLERDQAAQSACGASANHQLPSGPNSWVADLWWAARSDAGLEVQWHFQCMGVPRWELDHNLRLRAQSPSSRLWQTHRISMNILMSDTCTDMQKACSNQWGWITFQKMGYTGQSLPFCRTSLGTTIV